MNDEQLRQPSDVPAEQTSDFDRVANGTANGGSFEAKANGGAGTTAEMVAPQSVDLGGTSAPVSAPAEGIGVDATPEVPAGTASLVDDAQTADALASFHPEAPVGGTPEPAAELQLDVVDASDGGEEPEQAEQLQASAEPQVAQEPEAS